MTMNRHYLVAYLITILKSILLYMIYGLLILGAVGLLILLLSGAFAQDSSFSTEKIIAVLKNYLIIGLALGGTAGLLNGLLTHRQ